MLFANAGSFFFGPGFRTLSVSMVVSNLGRYRPPAEAPNRGASRAAGRPNMEPADGHVPPLKSASALALHPPGHPGDGRPEDGASGTLGAHPKGADGHPGGTWAHLSA